MTLDTEIGAARKEISADGYDMSLGELINLYRDGELRIAPAYQRLFRWDVTRKTRFIESILLGLPLPPIFVFQLEEGIWELIDGLQRMSTVLEFVGILTDSAGDAVAPLRLEGTQFLPSLAGKYWEESAPGAGDGIGTAQQIQLKRARMRVEILKKESDVQVKYELFQRLNTGGLNLSEQEVRNSVAIMIDATFQDWLHALSDTPAFESTTAQTDAAKERQAHVELVLRFLGFRNVPYTTGLDVHEYLDEVVVKLASNAQFDRPGEEGVFHRTFGILNAALGANAFKRWDGQAFSGKFLMSVFEVVALGVSRNLDALENLGPADRNVFLLQRCQDLWANPTFIQYSGAGVRGTARLANLLSLGPAIFQP
jgi:hypothetical protein